MTADRPRTLKLMIALAALLPVCAGGCCLLGGRPPVPPALSAEEVIAALQERARGFRTITDASASLRVQVEAGGEVYKQPSLGIVLAFDSLLPGLWLRAEKLGQKVFNLRAGADYFWLEIPDTKEVVTGGMEAYRQMPQLVHPYEVMLWFGSPEWMGLTWDGTRMTVQPEHYRFDVALGGLALRSVYVDRRSVAVSRIVSYDALGRTRTEVEMGKYQERDGTEFPHLLIVRRPRQGHRIEIRLGKPKLNRPINPAAFRIPRRPGWRHVDLNREPITNVKAFRGE